MVFSYFLLKYPYQFTWEILNLINKRRNTYFYAEELLDYIVFKPVQKYLKNIPVIVKNSEIKNQFKSVSCAESSFFKFPKALIMCRHVCHKFPEKKILKFGFRHGAYHFKKLTDASNYNAFTKYFVTSQSEVDLARKSGIHSTVSIGYPKLDPAFNGEIDNQQLMQLHQSLLFSSTKKTLLFTTTWDKSGMSAIDTWINSLDQLSEIYNIMVTVHPWTSQRYKHQLLANKKIHFINHPDVLPFLMLSDCVIGDTSSILAEACALNKSILTIKTGQTKRSLSEIDELIKSISFQINPKDNLLKNINYAVQNPLELQGQRKSANKIMFDNLDGKAGERAAGIILEYLPELLKS